MLVSGYNNIIVLPNCTMLYYVFSGSLSLRAYVPEIKFNNKNKIILFSKQGRFRLLPRGRGDSLGSEKDASLENTLVRFVQMILS